MVAKRILSLEGVNIRRLCSEIRASVQIWHYPSPERIMSIQSDHVDAILKVIEQSLPLMSDEVTSDGSASRFEVRILVDHSVAGAIIGRAGARINDIRDKFKSSIKVYEVCAPKSTDRCVAVCGTAEQVIQTLNVVLNITFGTNILGEDQPYDPVNFDEGNALMYGGYLSPVEVGSGGPITDSSDFGITALPGGFCETFGDIRGEAAVVKCPRKCQDNQKQTVQSTIPKDVADAFLGPGEFSITIGEAETSSGDRVVTISGTENQTKTGQRLLLLFYELCTLTGRKA